MPHREKLSNMRLKKGRNQQERRLFDEAGPSTSSAAVIKQQKNLRLGKEEKNCFLLLITGQIENVEILSVPNIYFKYCFVYGSDWKQVGGMEEGISATAYKTKNFNNLIVLNTPIEATFSSTNPFKWPQIVLSFYGQDHFGNDVIRGYTSTHLPTTPGSLKRRCPIFLPQSTTNIQRIIGLLTGRRAEFVDPTIIAKSEGRDGLNLNILSKKLINYFLVIRVSTQ
ncbi:hypothetical protein Mgra_00005647, partial [Meloidogyne graminicola]